MGNLIDSQKIIPRLGGAAILGAATGSIAVAGMMASGQLGEAPGVELFGVCIGSRLFGKCGGADWVTYLFPGLTFGLAFGGIFLRAQRLRVKGVIGFCAGTMVSNALAVTATLSVLDLLANVVSGRLLIAIVGAGGGAIGGGMLALISRGLLKIAWWPLLAVTGSLLGLLLPLFDWEVGVFGFYALWQAGYAGVLVGTLPRRTGLALGLLGLERVKGIEPSS